MKKMMVLFAAVAVSAVLNAATSTPAGFTDDLDAAIETAKKSGKTVFAVFSGSDWCHWCKVLEKDYLSKKEFVEEASKSFELVYIDTPNNKSLISEKAAKKNPELVKKYKVRGFPTVKFISKDGTALNASRPGKGVTPKAYAQALVSEIKTRPLFEKHLKPLKDELQVSMHAIFSELMKEGNYWSRATEAEQRAGFDKVNAGLKKGVAKMKEIKEKVASLKVPAELEAEKNSFVKELEANIAGMSAYASKSFEEMKKAYEADAAKRSKAKAAQGKKNLK